MMTQTTDTKPPNALERAGGTRTNRFGARNALREVSGLRRVVDCGNPVPHGVAIRAPGEGVMSAAFSGVFNCGSVWACPVCANKIATQRAADLAQGIAGWTDKGYKIEFLTLTARHNKQHTIGQVWDAVLSGWDSLAAGSGWKQDKKQLSIVAHHRTTEATYSPKHGWHIHFHVLLFLQRNSPLSDDERDHLRGRLFDRWNKGLDKKGLKATYQVYNQKTGKMDYPAVDLRPMKQTKLENVEQLELLATATDDTDLADYLSKTGIRSASQIEDGMRIAQEALGGNRKMARVYAGQKNLTPFGILGQIATYLAAKKQRRLTRSEQSDFAGIRYLWEQWEEFSKGKRQQTMSRNLKELLALDEADTTDEELADKEVSNGDILGIVPAPKFRTLLKSYPELLNEILTAAEQAEPKAALQALSDEFGLEIDVSDEGVAAWEAAQAEVDDYWAARKEGQELIRKREREQFSAAMKKAVSPKV